MFSFGVVFSYGLGRCLIFVVVVVGLYPRIVVYFLLLFPNLTCTSVILISITGFSHFGVGMVAFGFHHPNRVEKCHFSLFVHSNACSRPFMC